MKKQYALILLLVVFATHLNATIWRVNNDTAIDADFRTVQTAIDDENVLGGDTIHIEGSIYAYAGFNVTKKLVIIGPGYFLSENPNTYVNKSAANISGVNTSGVNINSITFKPGSDSSTVIGLYLYPQFNYPISIETSVNIITISKNYLSSNYGYGIYVGTSSSNHIITQNLFSKLDGTCTSCLVENNIIIENIVSCNGCTVRNNIVNADWTTGNSVTASYISSCTGSYFTNNIVGGIQSSNTNCEFTNNIFLAATASTDVDKNKFITSLVPVFSTTGTTDSKYKLSATSAAKGAADDGGDCGVFYNNNGGPIYVLSGLPPLPNVYSIKNTSAVSDTQLNLHITIGSRAE